MQATTQPHAVDTGLVVASAGGGLERYFSEMEIKALNTSERTIDAYVAVFGDPAVGSGADRNNDIIVKGAFANSILTKRQIPLIGHDLEALRIGRCVERYEDDYGLFTKTYVYETSAGNDLLETARQSLIELDPLGNSIGFKVLKATQAYIGGVVYRVLRVIDWVEYSFLATRNIAANPAARTLSVKAYQVEGPMHDLSNPEYRAALIEQRKASGLADDTGVDLELMRIGTELQNLAIKATSDLLAMSQLDLETKDAQRLTPTVFTSLSDLNTQMGAILDAARALLDLAGMVTSEETQEAAEGKALPVSPFGDSGTDESMAVHATTPTPSGEPGGGGSDSLPWSRDTNQRPGNSPVQNGQAQNQGGEHGGQSMHGARKSFAQLYSEAKAMLDEGKSFDEVMACMEEKSAPAEHGQPGGFDPAGAAGGGSSNGGSTATKADGNPPMPQYQGPVEKKADEEDDPEKKVAPPETTPSSNDDMNAKGMTAGSDEGGGFLTQKADTLDLERESLELLAIGAGVSIRG